MESARLIVASGLLAAVVTLIVTYFTLRSKTFTDKRALATENRSTDHARITALEGRVDKVEGRLLSAIQYAGKLRTHIFNGQPPPPPDWPTDLID